MSVRPTRIHETNLSGPIAGMDEAGCGPWAGPLVAAAVILPGDASFALPPFMDLVRDSKQLNEGQRLTLYHHITNDPNFIYGVGIVESTEIDTHLLRGALPLAFHRAMGNLIIRPHHVLIDGIRDPKLGIPTTLIKGGDRVCLAIAAASIIAKVTRDLMMHELHEQYPAYAWNSNKGYGTRAHQAALNAHGVTEHHRKSYAPIQRFLQVVPSAESSNV